MTRQRRLLLEYFSGHTDESISANDIIEELAKDQISKSAVYRNLSDLESEGKIRRVTQNAGREVYYQYADDEHCKEHLHLSCKKCGKTFHLCSEIADELIDNVLSREGFAVDKSVTVLYGMCRNCREQDRI